MLVHPAEDAFVQHELPDGPMAPWLQDGAQTLGDQPLAICCPHEWDQRLSE